MIVQDPPLPPTAPLPAQAPTVPVPVGVNLPGVPSSPADVYTAFRAQRRELGRQLESLEERREELSARLQAEEPPLSDVDRKGVEQRLSEIDLRIAEIDKQIAVADAEVARAIAVPGATIEPPPPPRDGPPGEVFVLGGMFIVVVLFPLAIAYSRRIWRRSAAAVTAFPQELADRLNRLEHSTDAIAVEVERIGEGQRFMTRVVTENGAPRPLAAHALDTAEIEASANASSRRR
jgi:hypothetical protein